MAFSFPDIQIADINIHNQTEHLKIMAAGKAKTEREKISILTMTEKAKAEARLINYSYKVRQIFGLKIIYVLLFEKNKSTIF